MQVFTKLCLIGITVKECGAVGVLPFLVQQMGQNFYYPRTGQGLQRCATR